MQVGTGASVEGSWSCCAGTVCSCRRGLRGSCRDSLRDLTSTARYEPRNCSGADGRQHGACTLPFGQEDGPVAEPWMLSRPWCQLTFANVEGTSGGTRWGAQAHRKSRIPKPLSSGFEASSAVSQTPPWLHTRTQVPESPGWSPVPAPVSGGLALSQQMWKLLFSLPVSLRRHPSS